MDRRMGVSQALIILVLFLSQTHAFVAGIDGPLIYKEALEDGNTTLSCDTTPGIVNDEIMLLVWYKGDESIYSYDARSGGEWSSPTFNMNERLKIDIRRDPSSLYLFELREDDQAVYHCRVEFLISPTKHTGVNLIVIVRPSKPFFMDELGNKIENKVGPYFEGDNLVLNCLVIGGRPPPHISWFSGDVLIDATGRESDIPNVRENELFLPLARDTIENVSCVASNTKLAPPVSAFVHIELYLPADNVTINWTEGMQNGSLQVGRTAIVQCIADGVYPTPDIAWWLNDKHLTQYSNQTYDRLKKRAISYLQLTPTMLDDRATFACMATSLAIPQGTNSKADVITLNVTYAPVVEISILGTSKLTVLENKTLNFLCEAKANPEADRFIWYFDGVKIDNDKDFNVTSNMMTIQEIGRMHAGQYHCAAANTLGVTEAEPIDITVLYPPECSGNGVTLSEEILICNVKAMPVPKKYIWRMQSDMQIQTFTTETGTIALSKVTLSLARTLNVSCKGQNDVDTQHKPCTNSFSFKHLRPRTLQQCDLAYEDDQFQIRCIPVDNATHYEVSVWRQILGNASITFVQRRILGSGVSQALAVEADESVVVKGELGSLRRGDEAGAAACNRYGCSEALLLRPTERLLSAVVVPWWKFLLDKNVGISIGGVLLVIVFVASTSLLVCVARRSCRKPPTPVIQVLQIDDVTRDFLNSTRDLKARSTCTLQSRSRDYLDGSEEYDLTSWCQVPEHAGFEPPPDVTLTMHRESAV